MRENEGGRGGSERENGEGHITVHIQGVPESLYNN